MMLPLVNTPKRAGEAYSTEGPAYLTEGPRLHYAVRGSALNVHGYVGLGGLVDSWRRGAVLEQRVEPILHLAGLLVVHDFFVAQHLDPPVLLLDRGVVHVDLVDGSAQVLFALHLRPPAGNAHHADPAHGDPQQTRVGELSLLTLGSVGCRGREG